MKCIVHIWLLHKIVNENRKQGRIKNAIKLCVGFHLETLNDWSLRCQVTSRVFSSPSSSSTWAAPPHRPQPIIVPHMRPKKSKLWWIACSSTKTSQMASTMLTPRMIEAYILILWKDICIICHFHFKSLVRKWATSLSQKKLPLIGWVPPNPQLFFFFYKKCAFGLKTAFSALFGPLCSWLVFAYFLTSFDPKTPLLSLLCDCFCGHIQEQKEAGRGYLPCGPIMQNNIGRSLNVMLLLFDTNTLKF